MTSKKLLMIYESSKLLDSESADVLIAVVKDLQTKSLWISVAVAGTNPYRFMLIFVRSCFRLPLLLLDLLVRVLLQGQRLILRGLKLPRRLCLVVLDKRCFPYIPYMYVVSTYIYIYITCMTRKVVAYYCCRTDTQLGYRPGRASFSSLSSDASASTFAGRRDAVYGARRSVSGSSRKACEWCVTLLDLCLFGLQLKHSRRCE